MNHDKLIEAARFFSSSDAHILRGLLEAEDVRVEIFDEQFSSLDPVDSVISGGIKLYIWESDVAKAEPVIKRYYDNLKAETGDVCPECNATDVGRDYRRQMTMIFYAFLGALLGTGFSRTTPQYKRCNRCGYRW